MSTTLRSQAIVVAIVWGLCFVVIQRSLPTATPLLLAALRALIGGAIVMLAVSGRRWITAGPCRPDQSTGPVPPPRGPGLPLLVVLAITNVTLAFGAMYLAAGRTDAGLATILGGTQPLFLAVGGMWLLGERVAARTMGALGISMTGLVLVAVAGSGTTGMEGVVLAVTAAAAPAVGTLLVRQKSVGMDLAVTTGVTLVLGGLLLLAVSAFTEPWSGVRWSIESVGSLLFLGIVGTGLAYVVWFGIAARVPVAALGSTLFVVPVAGVVASVLDGVQLSVATLFGSALMLAGALVASR